MTDILQGARAHVSFDELYKELRPNLVRALVGVTGSYEGVDDAIHEAFAQAMGADPGNVRNWEAWLFTVARNCLRRSRRRARLFRPLVREVSADTRELDTVLNRNHALWALGRLSERDQTLLVAKYYVGLSQEEIAKVTGLSRGTIASAISRAIARLREEEKR